MPCSRVRAYPRANVPPISASPRSNASCANVRSSYGSCLSVPPSNPTISARIAAAVSSSVMDGGTACSASGGQTQALAATSTVARGDAEMTIVRSASFAQSPRPDEALHSSVERAW